MTFFLKNIPIFIFSLLFIVLTLFFAWIDFSVLSLFPIALFALYAVIYHTEEAFLSLAFFTPLSVNIEEYVEGFGLFIPTEPLLIFMLLFLVFLQIKQPFLERRIWKNPIIIAVSLYLFWLFITAITSSQPLVSFKFLIAKIWFIFPILIFGTFFFKNLKNIKRFIWLLIIGMTIAIIYTLIHHSMYQFGEKEGHWVMSPFFKDHTIYGAIVALVVPLVFGIYLSKNHTVLIQMVLFSLIGIILLGLFFSYTRAAWLSIFAALGVWSLIRFKIKFKYLAIIGSFIIIMLFTFWDAIQMELARNKQEHTTEQFGEKLQSATNVTTDASNLERINRWNCAISMFQERPIFGFGPGTYAFEYARFQQPENLTIISTNFGDLGNAHSEYLGPLAESGIFGLITFLILVTTIFYKSIKLYNLWPIEDREIRTILLSIILSMVTYFVHGILNNYLDTDKAAIPIWGMCAIVIALEIHLIKHVEQTD